MEPNYGLDEITRQRIIELVNTCIKLKLGNVSFKYYEELVDYYMSKERDHWQLVVVHPFGKRDIYKIVDGIISYGYSEKEDSEKED